jgi:flagellar basal body-associated protein FliL
LGSGTFGKEFLLLLIVIVIVIVIVTLAVRSSMFWFSIFDLRFPRHGSVSPNDTSK